jgi:hypothetical protein
LQALHEAQEHATRLRQAPKQDVTMAMPPALREAFSTLGHARPTLGHQEPRPAPGSPALPHRESGAGSLRARYHRHPHGVARRRGQ